MPQVLEFAAASARQGVGGAMATVLARHGSAPSTPGQKLFVAANGQARGTVGGGAVEREVLTALLEMAKASHVADTKHDTRNFRLGPELGMCCGGSVDVLLEPIVPLDVVLIVGGGHVATATGPLLASLGFAVTVCDAREEWGVEARIPNVTCVVGEYDDVGKAFPTRAALLVMTHDHALDQQAIEWGLRRGFSFVGGVGSRAKAKRTRDRLEAKGVSNEDRERVRMPIGVDIGARLPGEIAVAIAAELIARRRG